MKKKILIVEDYNNIVEILTMRLNAMGYDVISAKDGQEGLNLARREKPDLIVLDVMLPKLNGYKISRLLKFDSRYNFTSLWSPKSVNISNNCISYLCGRTRLQ